MMIENDIMDVIKLGQSWGMSENEIKECLGVVANMKPYVVSNKSSLSPPTKNEDVRQHKQGAIMVLLDVATRVMKWLWYIVKCLIILLVLLALVLAVLYTVVLSCCALSPTLENGIGRVAAPLIYPTMRMARIALKPLADAFEISKVYSWDCLVENPFFYDPIESCEPCETKIRIIDLTGQSVKKMVRNVKELNPFVIRGYAKTPVDLLMLQKMYFENENQFKLGGTRTLQSNFDDVYNIADFFSKYNHQDLMNVRRGSGYVAWDTNSVPTSQAIRKVFPRPKFVMEHSEIALLKRIYIEGPLAGGHEVPIGGFANSWYFQGHGRRRIRLVPHPDCSSECAEMSIVLNAGDLVSYQDQFWRLLSEPAPHDGSTSTFREMSIGFAASFTI